MNLTEVLPIVTVVSAVLITLMILLQSRGATLGAGFGSSGELFTTRRGLEKNLYETTIVIAVIFVLSIVVNLIIS
ncbi:preprotein translocase subunit SecG [Candidatus Saccharibacteria bacterium]|nr:preprotein translocase subunit SecG [Candidatus Saccharibacteria bacterium]MCL1962924.1 preprotein translocase subunit SecG [Candidatus Saccharibacteria bacterium]